MYQNAFGGLAPPAHPPPDILAVGLKGWIGGRGLTEGDRGEGKEKRGQRMEKGEGQSDDTPTNNSWIRHC